MEPVKEISQSTIEENVPESSSNVGSSVTKCIDHCTNHRQLLDCLILAIIHKVIIFYFFHSNSVWKEERKNILDNNSRQTDY